MATSEPLTLEQIIEELGGIETVQQHNETFHEVVAYFYDNQASFVEEYPYKWIAVTKDRIVAIGDSLESVINEAKRIGFSNPSVLVRFLDPDPPALFL